MTHTVPPQVCSCGEIATERNRYFTGKPMTARDFTDEQQYFLSRHRLHNRLLHGWGIVCGLQVKPHPSKDCPNWVVITPGIAIDCCGRELVVAKQTALRIADPPDRDGPRKQDPGKYDPRNRPPPPDDLLIYLTYEEEPTDCVPVLYHEHGCDPAQDAEPNRVRERARLDHMPFADVEPGCWQAPDGSDDIPCRHDCDDDHPGIGGSCLEPDCPCGSKVPLAKLVFDTWCDFTISDDGVKRLRTPREYLTQITSISWPHGGEVSLSDLDRQGRTLTVRFDRPLATSDHDGIGINEYTFVAQYGDVQRDLEFLTADPPPTLSDDRCTAVFTIDEDYFRARRNIAGSTVFVTLKCDFILDCHSNAVDGNHLGGRLKSGNGTAGGTFESWFHVVPDGPYGGEE